MPGLDYTKCLRNVKSDQLWFTSLRVVEKEGREIVDHSYSRTYGRNCQTRRKNTKKHFSSGSHGVFQWPHPCFRNLGHTTKPISHSKGSHSGPIQEIYQVNEVQFVYSDPGISGCATTALLYKGREKESSFRCITIFS